METVMRSDEMKGFVVLPRRWVVERTFSWFGRNRRLAKDFENLAETMGAFVALASIQLALKAACQDVDRRRNKPTVCIALTVKVCKSDCEGTVAGTRGNGEVAPTPDLPALTPERGGSTHSGRSLRPTAMTRDARLRTSRPGIEQRRPWDGKRALERNFYTL
jgi:hypothetical protein